MLNVIDEFSRKCLALVALRRFLSPDVIDGLVNLFIEHCAPEHIRSDNGTEFVAHAARTWLRRLGMVTLYIAPGSPWGKRIHRDFDVLPENPANLSWNSPRMIP